MGQQMQVAWNDVVIFYGCHKNYHKPNGLKWRVKSWLKAQHSENEDHGIWSHHFMANMGKQWKQCQTLFFGAPKSLQMVIAVMKLKNTYSLEGKL